MWPLADSWRPYRSWASFLFRATTYGTLDDQAAKPGEFAT